MKCVLIVDDEELARNKIKRFLGAGFEIREACNGLEALKAVREEAPDLLFLDIEMPGLSGLDVLQNLDQRPFKLIFQTAYDEFALRAFDENACDYLLKPFDQSRFDKALVRALGAGDSDLRLQKLEQAMHRANHYLEKISVRHGLKTVVLPVAEIDGFTSQDHYTQIHRGTDAFLSDLSLSFLMERLNPGDFLRIHRRAVVRKREVQAVTRGPRMVVQLKSGLRLPVARGQRQTVLIEICGEQS